MQTYLPDISGLAFITTKLFPCCNRPDGKYPSDSLNQVTTLLSLLLIIFNTIQIREKKKDEIFKNIK